MGIAAEDEIETSADGDEITEAEIVERIFEAVMERRLPPGTKLSESALCQAFGVGRMRIRRCLLLLASREVVELHSNRGAYVASPTADQARDVFEARQAIEPAIVRLVVERGTAEAIDRLDAHTRREEEAHARGSRHEAIRLSGQFHVRLAEAAGNATLERMMKELVTRSSLILGIFGSPGLITCRDHDHWALIAALRARDAGAASAVMVEHLREIAASMDLTDTTRQSTDLAKVFAAR